MALIPGVGYRPGPGLCYWIWPGSRESAGTTRFNPAAGDPFGTGPGGVLDDAVFNARYGGRPIRFDGTVGNLVTDAETIFGPMTVAMEKLARQGAIPEFTGTAATHTLWPTLVEAHDWAATHTDGGAGLMALAGVGSGAATSTPPVVPKILEVSSPEPGAVLVRWTARAQDGFEVRVGDTKLRIPSSELAARVELPAGIGGEMEVAVVTYRGSEGRRSLPVTVVVAPREGEPPTPAPEPPPPAEPPVTPPEPADPECPALLAKAVLELHEVRAALGVKTTENEQLAADLKAALGNLRACQVERDRLGREVDALSDSNARLRQLVPVVVPPYVWEILTMLEKLPALAAIGPRTKQRIARLRPWIEGLSRRTP